jgi:hypothetical protein
MLKNKQLINKQLIIGILIGALVFGGIPAFAASQYILTQARYKIVVSGVEYTDTEYPILNYNGTTYVPLRAIGKLLGNEPRWNEEKRQVELGEAIDIDLSQWIDLITLCKDYGLEIVSGSKVFILKKGNITYNLTPINGNIKGIQYLSSTNGPEIFSCIIYKSKTYLKISELKAAGLLD